MNTLNHQSWSGDRKGRRDRLNTFCLPTETTAWRAHADCTVYLIMDQNSAYLLQNDVNENTEIQLPYIAIFGSVLFYIANS